MKVSDLSYNYPSELVATVPHEPCRIVLKDTELPPKEIDWAQFYLLFHPGDRLIINNTKVSKRRIFCEHEILFLKQISPNQWEVLFSARDTKIGDSFELFAGCSATLIKKGLPQTLETSRELVESDFENYGEYALPPYIQQARGERRPRPLDEQWYQPAFAKNIGSAAAPTASLHFTPAIIQKIKERGAEVFDLTLHVGLGTFLPIKTENTDTHKMHFESVYIPEKTLSALKTGRIFALGTTVARALEAYAQGHLTVEGAAFGQTDIFIQPGYDWKIVDALITNFHQPYSSLLAMVSSFAGYQETIETYNYAVENKLRLFSYGDLSVWTLKK